MKKQKSNIKYFYPVVVEKQLDFSGRAYEHEVMMDGHIVMDEALLCGIGRDLAKNRAKARKQKIVVARIVGVGICKNCLEKYKSLPGTDWSKWIRSVNNTVSNVNISR